MYIYIYIYMYICMYVYMYLQYCIHLISTPFGYKRKKCYLFTVSPLYSGFQTCGGKMLWIGFTWIVGGK